MAGWNLIPVLSSQQKGIETLFDGNLDKVLIVKEAMGKGIYWPEKNIATLENLSPGCSYFVKVKEGFIVSY